MKGLSTPVWDGKAKMCLRYLAQTEALAEYYDCGDALDARKMTLNCLTKTEIDALGTTAPMTLPRRNSTKPIKKSAPLSLLGRIQIMDL